MRLRCFAFFIMGIVQVSYGQIYSGSDLRGSSQVTLAIHDFSFLTVPEMNGAKNGGSLSGEKDINNPSQSLFIGKGINGVFLEISVPVFFPEAALAEERSPETGSDSLKQVCHFDGGQRSIKSLIAAFCPGPFNRLFDAVGCQYTENYRDSRFKAYIGDPLGNFRSNKIEMRRRTPDHGTQADHCIVPVFLGCGKPFRQ